MINKQTSAGKIKPTGGSRPGVDRHTEANQPGGFMGGKPKC